RARRAPLRRVGRGGEPAPRAEGAAHLASGEQVTAPSPAPQTKAARHTMITAMLARQEVRSQVELAEVLAGEGLTTTQATLSRDLVELRAVKVRGASGALVYALPGE